MADESKNIEGDENEGGGKKKLIIIIIAAVLLMLGGAAATYFMMSGGEAEEGEASAEAVEEESVEDGDPLYIELKPKFIVNLPPGGPAAMLQTVIQVYTLHAEVGEFLEEHSPMIRHDLNNLLESQESSVLLTLEGKKGLQKAVHELLTKKMEELDQPGEIKSVFFTEFVLQ